MLGGGIALGMSECDVVFRAGQPSSVQIGNAPNGDRTAVLTYQSGPRPGIYHFLRGGLTEMDGVPPSACAAAGRQEKADEAEEGRSELSAERVTTARPPMRRGAAISRDTHAASPRLPETGAEAISPARFDAAFAIPPKENLSEGSFDVDRAYILDHQA